jgi:hypothetical protein
MLGVMSTIATYPTWPGRENDVEELVAVHGPDMDAVAEDAARLLPPGLYGQPYLAKVSSEHDFAAYCAEWKSAGGVGMCVHSNSVDLAKRYGTYAKIIVDAGLVPVAVAGLDTSDPLGKAHRLGAILARDDCHALGHDLEGKAEDEAAQHEWSHAMDYARELLRIAGPFVQSKLLFDQPWPVPTKHWSRFPYEPYAGICRAHAEQDYEEDWAPVYHHERHNRCLPLFNGSWSTLDGRLSSQRLKRVRWHTIEGYGYADGMLDGLRYYLAKSLVMPIFVWTEWRAIQIVMNEIIALHKG